MAPKRHLLHYIRYTHLYLGVFIAPALLFFAFTGALQTFSFHETTKGSSYKPPAWIATLAQIHKKQTTTIPPKKLLPPTDKADDSAPHHHAKKNASSPTAAAPATPSASTPSPSTSSPATSSPETSSPAADSPATSSSATSSPMPSSSAISPQQAPSPGTPSSTTPHKAHNPLPLKFFFLLVSLGLFTSTISGLYMSYRYSRNRALITTLLIAGIIIPTALIFL